MTVTIKREVKHFVSYLSGLDIVSQGDTIAEAVDNLAEAFELFMINCNEAGTLDKVLKDAGAKAVCKYCNHPNEVKVWAWWPHEITCLRGEFQNGAVAATVQNLIVAECEKCESIVEVAL